MNKINSWQNTEPKLIAILRGITKSEVTPIVKGLIDIGFRAIEIPLNSPDPMASIELAVKVAKDRESDNCLIGAGTVLTVDQVRAVAGVGGNLIVSPNVNPAVIKAAIEANMVCLPGIFTPTEAHLALASGASGLKFFPAVNLGSQGINAIRAILPVATSICAVGGIEPDNFAEYAKVGVCGFGLGSGLYKPGMGVDEVLENARTAMSAYASCTKFEE